MSYRLVFLRDVPYFDEPVGLVKIRITSKNTQRYDTPKGLLGYLLSNTPNCCFNASEFRGYLLRGVRDRSMLRGTASCRVAVPMFFNK